MVRKDQSPVIVTGFSGAGISSVLKALEDFHFEVFDNFPVALVRDIFTKTKPNPYGGKRVAIGIDARTRGYTPESVKQLAADLDATLLFITCDDVVLQRRFTATRRRHPLARDTSLLSGIKKEKELLLPLKKAADIVIDSSEITIHDLRHILEGYFADSESSGLIISLMSFGFRNGVPREADIVMDVRFLMNPHWIPALQPKTGLDQEVGEYISQDRDFESFIQCFKAMILPLLPRYREEGKNYLTIAIGCTGGQHRSVFTVEVLKKWFESQNINVFVEHRDIEN